MNTIDLALEIINARSEFVTESGCQIWTGSTDTWGYGTIRIQGKLKRTHRLKWEQSNGPIPHGLLVCHRCDVPSCVNPNHLFLGTDADNHRDMVQKGRLVTLKGERNGRAKLTEEQVLAIRNDARPRKQIAQQYSISLALIQKIKHLDNWTHL